ncbi:hypothetical protein KY289_035781 [Solanum tuberosum]|nr:hypothetical protein KY289_035781 [Solanum tuberosum]
MIRLHKPSRSRTTPKKTFTNAKEILANAEGWDPMPSRSWPQALQSRHSGKRSSGNAGPGLTNVMSKSNYTS